MSDAFPLRLLGDPILRSPAQPIADLCDPEVQATIDALLARVVEAHGVGLAAPQIGRDLQVLVIASRPNRRYPHAPEMAPIALVNPRILSRSPDREKDWEGCLSVPGIRGLVPRHRAVTVEYCDREGNAITQTFEGFVARIFQHEYDHLIGRVFLDGVESSLDLMSDAEYLKRVVGEG